MEQFYLPKPFEMFTGCFVVVIPDVVQQCIVVDAVHE